MSDRNHFNNLLLVVGSLVREGALVRVWTDRAFRADVDAVGAEFADLFDPVSLDRVDDASRPLPCRFVTFAAARSAELADAVRQWGADVVVYDSFALVGRVVAARLRLPFVPLFSGHAPEGQALRAALEADTRVALDPRCIEAARALRTLEGLADASPFSYVADPSPFLNVLYEPEEWMNATELSYFRPLACFGSLPAQALDRPPAGRGAGGFHLYAAFGTIIWRYWAAEAVQALLAIAAAASELPGCRLTIGLGGATLPDAARAALQRTGARLLDFADQSDELATADAFVTHHGLASTHEAVAFGVPMLSLPFFWDQPALAARCAELGLALPLLEGVLPGQTLAPAAVLAALHRLGAQRAAMAERLQAARAWERRVVAARPDAARAIMALGPGRRAASSA